MVALHRRCKTFRGSSGPIAISRSRPSRRSSSRASATNRRVDGGTDVATVRRSRWRSDLSWRWRSSDRERDVAGALRLNRSGCYRRGHTARRRMWASRQSTGRPGSDCHLEVLRPKVLRGEFLRSAPTSCHRRGQDPQRREARRPPRRAADEVRAGDQPQDGRSAAPGHGHGRDALNLADGDSDRRSVH